MFEVSQNERSAGRLDGDKLSAILSAIRTDGYAILGGLVSDESCDLLLNSSLEDVRRVQKLSQPTRHERVTGQGHLQLGLRRSAPYVRADLLANPIIEHVVVGVLGDAPWLGFYNGNVNLPGSVHQPLHFDRPFSWRSPEAAAEDGQPWPPPPTTLSCSLALSEIREDNGATEIYPGSHHETAVADWPPGKRLSEDPDLIRRRGAPTRMPIPAGGVCFRDPRMWHRGVPNPGDVPRPMVALTYHAARCQSWRGRLLRDLDPALADRCALDPTLKVLDDGSLADGRLVFEENAREVFESADNPHGVNRNVRFIPPPRRVNHFLDAHSLGGARVVEALEVGPESDS